MNTSVWNLGKYEEREFDRSILWGFGVAFGLVAVGLILSGGGLEFLNLEGFLLVAGGTFGATLVHHSPADMRRSFELAREAFFVSRLSPIHRMKELVRISQRVKQEGMLILEDEVARQDDGFLRLALDISVDTQPERDIKRILETEIITSNEAAQRASQVFQVMGTYAPALGLIGTLIGLIKLMGQLNDPSTVGPAMSLALVTTLYGAVFANMVFLPISGKLRLRNDEQSLMKAMTVEGILSIVRQESPLILEQRLQRFFPPFA
jgi:chemotaxis protein MotA